MFAVGTATGGMFQKAQSQVLWESERPTPWPCTRPSVSLQSPGVRFLHQGNLGGSLQGCLVGTSSPQLCVCYPSWASCAGLGCQDWPHTQGLSVGLFSESGCPGCSIFAWRIASTEEPGGLQCHHEWINCFSRSLEMQGL